MPSVESKNGFWEAGKAIADGPLGAFCNHTRRWDEKLILRIRENFIPRKMVPGHVWYRVHMAARAPKGAGSAAPWRSARR
jgi:hypothetical protein